MSEARKVETRRYPRGTAVTIETTSDGNVLVKAKLPKDVDNAGSQPDNATAPASAGK